MKNTRHQKIAIHLKYRGDNGYGSHSWDFRAESPALAEIGCDNLLVFTRSKNIGNAAAYTFRVIMDTAKSIGKGTRDESFVEKVLAAIDGLPEMHITRDEMIRRAKDVAGRFARELDCPDLEAGEDRQKGIWGEEATRQLEKEYGPCTEQLTWTSRKNGNRVGFRFRFANPVIWIDLKNGVYASVEIGRQYDAETKTHHGDWGVSEVMTLNCWDIRRYRLADRIIKALVEANIIRR